MGNLTIEATITFPESEGELCRTLSVEETGGFGLLERVGEGWTLCIPYGAKALCEGVPVDLESLSLDNAWERRLPYAFGGTAQVEMDGMRFELRAS